jgi:hypothetical protein
MPPYRLEERRVVLGETFVGRQCGHGYAMVFSCFFLQLQENETKEEERIAQIEHATLNRQAPPPTNTLLRCIGRGRLVLALIPDTPRLARIETLSGYFCTAIGCDSRDGEKINNPRVCPSKHA